MACTKDLIHCFIQFNIKVQIVFFVCIVWAFDRINKNIVPIILTPIYFECILEVFIVI